MQVYHQAGVVLATHPESQIVPSGAYGDAKRVIVPDDVVAVEAEDQLPTLPSDLASLSAIASATISAWKRRQQDGGFSHAGKMWDSDDRSRLMLSGAVQMAQIAMAQGQPFSISWVAADNSAMTLDAAGIVALGVAAGQHVAAVHEAALGHKTIVSDTEDAADVIVVLGQIGAW